MLGATELLIILGIALLLFGGTQLPKLARSLGQAQKELKKGMEEGASDDPGGSVGDSSAGDPKA